MSESILIIGAGMAGLCSALALAGEGRSVTILEKDPPPPEGGAEAAFTDWKHNGVGHLRHSHAFLARLRTLIKQHHPALLTALTDAGARELTMQAGIPLPMQDVWVPQPGDEEMAVITSRRTTLELVMRRYVEDLAGVSIRSGVFVREAIIESEGGVRRVAGVRVTRDDGAAEDIRADVTVDAGGRLSAIPEQLEAAGAKIDAESEACGILYYTRHYRLRPGQDEPPRTAHGGTGDLGYIKFGLFPADNGWFSVTFAVPEIEEGLRAKVIDPQAFDAICAQMPGLKDWVDPARAEPMSRVFGMGDLIGHWRRFVTDAGPAALGYFPVGDALVRTNPLFGRGCSFAAVAAFTLADVLRATADPARRPGAYQGAITTALRPYYEAMRSADRASIKRAAEIVDPSLKKPPTLRGNIMKSFGEDGAAIAIRSDPVLFRAAMRDFHMLDKPGAWMRNPTNLLRIVRWWARGKTRNADRYAPKYVGPERAQMFGLLGLA